MAICECGAETTRLRVLYDGRNKKIGEECPNCKPHNFHEKQTDPSDLRPWDGAQVYPKLYKLGSDGIYHAKDELIADTVENMGLNYSHSEAIADETKRKTRRTTPMTEQEIAGAMEWGREVGADALMGKRATIQ